MFKMRQNFGFFITLVVLVILLIFMTGCESQEKANAEKLKVATRNLIEEAYNKGDLDVVDDCCAAGFVYHVPPYPDVEGTEAYKKYISDLRAAYSNLQLTIDEMIIEGDIGAMKWTFRGTHTGQSPTLGIPPTGKQVTFSGCSITRFVDGKFAETWNYVDYLGLMTQLGFKIVPPSE